MYHKLFPCVTGRQCFGSGLIYTRSEYNLSGKTGSMFFSRPDPDPRKKKLIPDPDSVYFMISYDLHASLDGPNKLLKYSLHNFFFHRIRIQSHLKTPDPDTNPWRQGYLTQMILSRETLVRSTHFWMRMMPHHSSRFYKIYLFFLKKIVILNIILYNSLPASLPGITQIPWDSRAFLDKHIHLFIYLTQ